MSSDRSKFNRARDHRDELLARGRVSSSPEVGYVALLTSYGLGPLQTLVSAETMSEAVETMQELEAAFAKRIRFRSGHRFVQKSGIGSEQIQEIITDRTVASIYLLGHGALSSYYLDSSDATHIIDWRDLSGYTTHLKQGQFTALTCGGKVRKLNVPLGTFTTTRYANVYGPLESSYQPEPCDLQEELIGPLLPAVGATISVETIRQFFPQSRYAQS